MSLRLTRKNAQGIPFGFHHISAIEHRIGYETLVCVKSYIDEETYRNATPDDEDYGEVFFEVNWYTRDYDDGFRLADAYAWLKSMPEFEGAEDVY